MQEPSVERKRRYLDFEKPLQDLDAQILQLKNLRLQGQVDVSHEIKALEHKSEDLLKKIFASLTPYQVVQLARHPDRPTTLEYIHFVFEDFIELHGDRTFMEDASIVGGLAELNGTSVIVIGHQKGRTTQENMRRNFGMPRPEGYRKAMRLMKMAERFQLPIITFIDTPGAYPGIEAEERGQAQAIAESILQMTDLNTPILSLIIGEGGSGGALAVAVSDRLLMLEYSIYSVISPEGCAAITWKDPSFTSRAAEALQLTAAEIKRAQVADRIIEEPLGGAHRDPMTTASRVRDAIVEELEIVRKKPLKKVLSDRYAKFRSIGVDGSVQKNWRGFRTE